MHRARTGDLSRAARPKPVSAAGRVDRADSRSVCSRINQGFQSATDHRACKRWIRGRALAGLEAIRCAVEPGIIIVRELEVGGFDVRLELCDAARARDGHDIGVSDDPRQGHLGRSGVVQLRHLAQRVKELAGAGNVLWQEEHVPPPYPASRRVRTVVAAREQPLRERAVRDDETSRALRVRKKLALGFALDE